MIFKNDKTDLNLTATRITAFINSFCLIILVILKRNRGRGGSKKEKKREVYIKIYVPPLFLLKMIRIIRQKSLYPYSPNAFTCVF